MAITRALGDEQRVRLLLALRQRELCVCQLVELVGLATSTVSKHMSILKQAQLVESRKEGRWIYYRLPCDHVPRVVQQAIDWVVEHLTNDPRIKQDQQQVEAIDRIDPQQLCKGRIVPQGQSCKKRAEIGSGGS